MFRISFCASCQKRTDYPAIILKYRKNVSNLQIWMQNAIKIIDSNPCNSNPYICRACYDNFNKIGSVNGEFDQFLITSDFEPTIIQEKEDNFKKDCVLDFDSIDSNRCLKLTGLTQNDFDILTSHLEEFEPPVRLSLKNCIGFYLMRLKLGISAYELGFLYDKPSVHQVKEIVKFVRHILKEKFTPLNFGVNANYRKDIVENHTTNMAKILSVAEENSIISIWDATSY